VETPTGLRWERVGPSRNPQTRLLLKLRECGDFEEVARMSPFAGDDSCYIHRDEHGIEIRDGWDQEGLDGPVTWWVEVRF
jgi:hypothetical protein